MGVGTTVCGVGGGGGLGEHCGVPTTSRHNTPYNTTSPHHNTTHPH